MELETGRALIEAGISPTSGQEVWVDLGAGDGFFTTVLASLLPNGSRIYAIDKAPAVMGIKNDRAVIKPIVSDFNMPLQHLEPIDGILLANALHYVRYKLPFVETWRKNLKSTGVIIVVEYDTDRPNQWVPYPVSWRSLQNLAKKLNAQATLLGNTPSIYQAGGIYAAALSWNRGDGYMN